MKLHSKTFLFPLTHLKTSQKIIIALFPMFILILLKPWYPPFLQKTPIVLFYPLVLLSTWLCGGMSGFLTLISSSLTIFLYIRPELISEMSSDPPIAGRFAMFYISTLLFQLLVAMLERSLKEAEDSIKDRDAFLSIVSHELRTPITTIKLQLEVLKDQMKERELNLSPVKSIERQIYRQNKLVSSMLDLAMIQSGDIGLKTEKWYLDEIVSGAVRNAVDILNVGDVKLNLEHALIRCDRKRIEQTVYNLVHNALKYGDRDSVEVSVHTDQDYATIDISNSGKPIENKYRTVIFNKMKRPEMNDQVQGLGIGLYLARHLVELHGGKIDLSSTNEKTVFSVKLPLEVHA